MRIVAVNVAEGADTPYVHNDGRIYRRVGDASQPTPVTDRAAFDLLAHRGSEARGRLADLISRDYSVSQEERDTCYVHMNFLSDPYGTLYHRYHGDFDHFASLMADENMPHTNVFTTPPGYVARQVSGNDPYRRLMSWHFSVSCHSHFTVPVPLLNDATLKQWGIYENGAKFRRMIEQTGSDESRILDLHIIPALAITAARRHLRLGRDSGIEGPVFAKLRLQNVWRCIPFLDCAPYLDHICKWHFPICQEDDIMIPSGTTLDSFSQLDLSDWAADTSEEVGMRAGVNILVGVLNALGLPGMVIIEFRDEIGELGKRRMEFQRA